MGHFYSGIHLFFGTNLNNAVRMIRFERESDVKANYDNPYSEFVLCINPSKLVHTHTHTHTHTLEAA